MTVLKLFLEYYVLFSIWLSQPVNGVQHELLGLISTTFTSPFVCGETGGDRQTDKWMHNYCSSCTLFGEG